MLSNGPHVSRSRPAGLRISDDFKRYTHPWGEQWSAGRDRVDMDEQVATAALIGLDEAEAARQVEEFHGALWHRPLVFVLSFPPRSSGGMACRAHRSRRRLTPAANASQAFCKPVIFQFKYLD
jgi:hypothetical protein